MAVGSEDWQNLPVAGKGDTVRPIIMSSDFWTGCTRLLELLEPFSDVIHQLEGDMPHMAAWHVAL